MSKGFPSHPFKWREFYSIKMKNKKVIIVAKSGFSYIGKPDGVDDYGFRKFTGASNIRRYTHGNGLPACLKNGEVAEGVTLDKISEGNLFVNPTEIIAIYE